MKKKLFYLIVFLFPVYCSAQQIDEKSQKLIDEYIKTSTQVTTVAIDPQITSKIFYGNFFRTKLEGRLYPGGNDGREPYDDFVFNINENKMTEFNAEYNKMIPLVRKEFLLKDEASAALFEKALFSFYPGNRTIVKKTHKKSGNNWLFTATDTDLTKTYVVTVTPAGKITKIDERYE